MTLYNLRAHSALRIHNSTVFFSLIVSKDVPSCIKRTAEFLEKPLTEEAIQQIAHQCSIRGDGEEPGILSSNPWER